MLQGIKVNALLDLGRGNGVFGSHISRIVQANAVVGLDVNENVLNAAKRLGYCVFNLNLNYNYLPFSDKSFDLVLCCEVIEHLTDPDRILLEIVRVLTPRGYLVVSTPNMAWYVNRIVLMAGYQPYWTEASARYNVGKFRRRTNEVLGHIRLFSYRALKELLKIYGFQLLSIKGTTTNSLPSFLGHIDAALSLRPSWAQVILILAQKTALDDRPMQRASKIREILSGV